MTKKIEGILPAIVTPLMPDNKTVKVDAVKPLIDLHVSQGASGFYVLGGTGEGINLEEKQRMVMAEAAIDAIGGRVTAIDHIAAVDMNQAVRLAKHAEQVGYDAIAAIPPVFLQYPENDIYNYYKRLADAVNIPLIIYYHPGAQGAMSPDLIARIFTIDNVTGVKWSSPDLFSLMKLKDKTHGEMNIISGPDELLCATLAAGADAGIGSTYNVMLPEFCKLFAAHKAGDFKTALETQLKINRVLTVLCRYKVIPAVKAALGFMGYDVGDAAFPWESFDDTRRSALKAELAAEGWPFVR